MATLNWIGKEAVVNHHRHVPYRLLKAHADLSVGEDDGNASGNLLVQGDNLEALKALLPYYGGKVKCIYIDPPYNTGNEKWVYNDNVNSPQISAWLERTLEGELREVGKEGEDLSRHDKWLCMMYPRLALLRDFLTEDGLIFVSIDDYEVAHLRIIMDEVFGRRNFFATMTRRCMHTVRNSSKDFNLNTDFVLVYGRDKEAMLSDRCNYIREPADKEDDYPMDDGDGKGRYKLDPISARNFYEPYEYTFSNGVTWSAPAGSYPRYAVETLAELERDGAIVFRKSGPVAKRYLKDVQEGRPPDALMPSEKVGFNKDGTSLLGDILGGGTFSQPKPVQLIEYILSIASRKDSIIMDSFAGSGTTGHAVLAMNKADGGNRKFILVEMDETIATTITRERLARVVEGYHPGGDKKKPKVEGLGGGFRYASLGPTLFDEYGRFRTGEDKVTFAQLAAHIYFTQTGKPLPKTVNGKRSPLIGVDIYTAYYLLYNGILGDKTPDGGNVLTRDVLAKLPANPKGDDKPRIVYGEACRLSEPTLRAANITFKQIPYQVEVG